MFFRECVLNGPVSKIFSFIARVLMELNIVSGFINNKCHYSSHVQSHMPNAPLRFHKS